MSLGVTKPEREGKGNIFGRWLSALANIYYNLLPLVTLISYFTTHIYEYTNNNNESDCNIDNNDQRIYGINR